MSKLSFVPDSFAVPLTFDGPGFHLEPLAPVHNERDHEAWMSSIDHIRATPGMDWESWPTPMSLVDNMADMEMHYQEFVERKSFTYSILNGDEVIGCVYILPSKTDPSAAHVRSWVTQSRPEMDRVIWESLSAWLAEEWPFTAVEYAPRS
jgi:hypothetical protein